MDSSLRKRKGIAGKPLLVICLGAMLLSLLLSGCSRLEGWGLVLWSVKGTSAKAGAVVPVYLKSNISKTYVIGLPDDEKSKIEVSFPSLEFFSSKKAAAKKAQEFAPYAAMYLSAGRDGLPVREKPGVSTRRVYRLRLGESVKVLGEAPEGEAVFTGGKALPGKWYFVQATDGTRGYVFSNTMVLYEEKEGTSAPVIASAPAPSASLLDIIYAKPWRPAYYQFMIDDSTIDPDLFILQYGLFADAKNSQIRVELPGYSNVFNFGSVSQSGDWLMFEQSTLRIRFENESTIVASWGDGDPVLSDEGWTRGGQAARFVQLDTSIPVMLSGENSRRDSALKTFFQRSASQKPNKESVDTFLSDSAGILSIELNGTFEWSHTDQLPAGFVPEIAGSAQESIIKGKIRFGLHLGMTISSAWMGGFSLLVGDNPDREDFVYRFENDHLVIAKADSVTLRGITENLDTRFSTVSYYLVVK